MTLYELDTVYGVEDLYDILEILTVDAHNKMIVQRSRKKAD